MFRTLVAGRSTGSNILLPNVWTDLWRLKLHEGFKLLLGKVAWDVLPTKCKVAERVGGGRISEELQCGLCGEELETLHHMLFFCPYSRCIWSESKCKLNITALGSGSARDWVTKIVYPH